MIKNRTDERLKIDLADSGWSSEFKIDNYGMSVRLFNAKDEMVAFSRFKPHDVVAIQDFLIENTPKWDQDEI